MLISKVVSTKKVGHYMVQKTYKEYLGQSRDVGVEAVCVTINLS
jgi:hypothetical protein